MAFWIRACATTSVKAPETTGIARTDFDAFDLPNIEPRSFRSILNWISRSGLLCLGLTILGIMIAIAIVGPILTELGIVADPGRQALTQRFQSPSLAHPLGTDEFGRDLLARLLLATRVSLAFGFVSGGVALVVGVAFGLVSGYFRGRIDDAINALIGTLQNIPYLFLLILLSVTFRPSIEVLAVILGMTGWTGIARQVRGVTLVSRERQYIEAARALGASDVRIIVRHILPSLSSLILVLAGFDIAGAILAESSLSFLGFGVQVPTPSWGNMLQRSLDMMGRAPWLVIVPGIMIVLAVLALFLIADGLRDALDPHDQRAR